MVNVGRYKNLMSTAFDLIHAQIGCWKCIRAKTWVLLVIKKRLIGHGNCYRCAILIDIFVKSYLKRTWIYMIVILGKNKSISIHQCSLVHS